MKSQSLFKIKRPNWEAELRPVISVFYWSVKESLGWNTNSRSSHQALPPLPPLQFFPSLHPSVLELLKAAPHICSVSLRGNVRVTDPTEDWQGPGPPAVFHSQKRNHAISHSLLMNPMLAYQRRTHHPSVTSKLLHLCEAYTHTLYSLWHSVCLFGWWERILPGR